MKNKITKRLLAIAMAVTVAVTAAPLTAEAAPVYNKSQVIYMSDDLYYYELDLVSNLTKKQTISKASVKSDNKKVAEPSNLRRVGSSVSYKTEYFSSYYTPVSSSINSYRYYMMLDINKPGTATISYKVKGINKTQKSKITVKEYENPVKSLKISGISGNLKSMTAKSRIVDIKLKKKVKNVTVKVVPAKGWKVQNIYVGEGTSYSDITEICNWTKKTGSATVNVGNFTKNKLYELKVEFVNTSNNGTITCLYWINN